MKKSITTLVDDIYKLLETDQPLTETQVESLGASLTAMLKRRLSSPKEERKALSMSSFGSKCLRQLWYKQNKPELAEPLPGRARLNYLVGDVTEEVVLSLAKATGHSVEGEQDTLTLAGVEGHRDAVIDGITIDVKTANSRSFEKFKYHKLETEDPFGYIDQISMYVEAAKDDPKVTIKGQGGFLAFDKELGTLALDIYNKKETDYDKRAEEIRSILAESKPPKRAYLAIPDGKSGNEMIPMECRYCLYKKECWKDVNNGHGLRKFIYSNGPRWLTKVVRLPEVPEDRS